MRLAMFLVVGSIACHSLAGDDPPAQSGSVAEAADIATSTVEVRRAEGTLPLAGELLAWQEVSLRARLPAFVQQRRVDVGDHVEKDQVLAVLSAPDRVAERAQAQAELAAARARASRLSKAAGRVGVVAPLELEEARAAREALQARVHALRELERELVVRAPFPGIVTARGADEGTLVGPGTDAPLPTIVDTSKLRLVVAVPERFTRAAVLGAAVKFRLEDDEVQRLHNAVVSRTSGMLDLPTRTLRVELEVSDTDRTLQPGSYVEVLWPTDTGEERAWVPATAIVRSTEGTWVFLRRGDALVKAEVEEVLREGEEVAVMGTVKAGDVVVTRGSEDLTEGPWPGSRDVPETPR
jgi:RND family efflux transporter MFP subunit